MVGRHCRMKRDKASDSGDGCWKAKDEHWIAHENHEEKQWGDLHSIYTASLFFHCEALVVLWFVTGVPIVLSGVFEVQLYCKTGVFEYLRCNCFARSQYLSIWGTTILEDQTNWIWMHLFNFCSKRSWHMYSNHFNKQMSFCPNHLSLVTNELRPKCSLKIFWVWISGEALNSPLCTKSAVLVICVNLTSSPFHSSCTGPYIVKCVGVYLTPIISF